MIKLRTITMKNFLSVGNITQAVNLDEDGLSLILGENIDQGGGGSRNGVGKTTLVQAICFALYGQPLTKIKKDNLINKTNQKNMAVSLDFEIGGRKYRIERGRKPNFIRYMVDDGLVNAPDTDESHGESKWTQNEIEKVIGMSHTLFKHIVALHTKTTPFLALPDKDQRDIIEELLGINQLSNKASQLKDIIKQIKDEVKSEEIRIKAVIDSNEKIQKTINELQFKNKHWEKSHEQNINKLQDAISQLTLIDIEQEIANHRLLADWHVLNNEVTRASRDASLIEKSANAIESNVERIQSQIKSAEDHNCPTCGQDLHDEKHDEILSGLRERESKYLEERTSLQDELSKIAVDLEATIAALTSLGDQPSVTYNSLEEALNHLHTLDTLRKDLEREEKLDSPFIDQIATLSTSGLQEISYEYLNELSRLKDHQDFLVKLLTDKNSFIRKKIIDQNINYLNHRLNSYLTKLQLPHEVAFQSDLGVEITNLGKDYDFEQLSNGESNRLVLALAWSFRDVWETMNRPLNLMIIDELVDSGMDSQGMDSALELLKKSARERNKNIFLISHKDELTSRVAKILLVQKENGFTTFVSDTEQND
jgi:DNA repair exonuclease SbcCD ATPase subunit